MSASSSTASTLKSTPPTSSPSASKPKKRFIGSKSAKPSKPGSAHLNSISNQIPSSILDDTSLNAAIQQLPSNYSFEIHKTIHHVRKNGATMVALQMPEGLQMFACVIADIVETFTDAGTVILGDVTYGACCVDDFTAVALGCDMLVHYGHSCLVPMTETTIKCLYVFVEIGIDSYSFEPDSSAELSGLNANIQPTRLALVSTIQFVAALNGLKEDLVKEYSPPSSVSSSHLYCGKYEPTIPRAKPLSPGEILGCTAPSLGDVDAILYLGDGRFHLESIMIANPSIPAFRYDPYSKKLTRERYDHREMRDARQDAVQAARKSILQLENTLQMNTIESVDGSKPKTPLWGVILGTLGRQGNFKQLQALTKQLSQSSISIPYMPILLSELSPAKLALFDPYISTFVQTSCPRLSIDWGYAFGKPLLSPYEATLAVEKEGKSPGWMNREEQQEEHAYPMNFYTANSPWAIARSKGSFDVTT
ncbi:putative diphthamide synthesis protein-domain-containing protein [Flagelloscypha sp. PMI_526]|nr:putative diphthamide synthesis protein-domain-containing protein [Flagelloscypha sp. PMI_526]